MQGSPLLSQCHSFKFKFENTVSQKQLHSPCSLGFWWADCVLRHFLWRVDWMRWGWVGPVGKDMVLMRASRRLHLSQGVQLLFHRHGPHTRLRAPLPDAWPTKQRGEKRGLTEKPHHHPWEGSQNSSGGVWGRQCAWDSEPGGTVSSPHSGLLMESRVC